MNKKIILKVAVIAIIILAVVALIIFGINWRKNAPVRLVEKYLTETENGNIDKMKKMFDFKGWYAWIDSDEDFDEFKKIYDDVSDKDIDGKLDNWGYGSKEDYLKSIMYGDNNVSYKISNEPSIKKLGKKLYEVKTKIKVDDDGYKFTETWKFIIYKDKIIYMTDLD